MPSWRETASNQAQDDLDQLLNVALGFAQEMLAKHGEFYPYAAAIRNDGEPEMVAVQPDPENEYPDATAVAEACFSALASRRDEIRACAVVTDVRVSDGGDAIQVTLEHKEGPALGVLLPYEKNKAGGEVDYSELRGLAGEQRVWV